MLCLGATSSLLTPAAFPLAALGMLLSLGWVLAFSIGALRPGTAAARARQVPAPRRLEVTA